MNRRFARGVAAAVLVIVVGRLATAAADDSPITDKAINDALKDVHNYGADLYNQTKDYAGAFRVYEGALKTVRPLLAHHPAIQKTIDTGLSAASAEPDTARRAYLLHETIEKVRASLKTGGVATKKLDEVKKPVETKTPDEVKKPVETKKPAETKPNETKKPAETKPKDPVEPAPVPKPKDPVEPAPKGGASVTGKITLAGKPLAAGEIAFVTLDEKSPKVVIAAVKEGSYTVSGLKPGKYVLTVTGDKDTKVPAKYATTDSSGLTLEVKGGAEIFDIVLK
jgi:hypothetical protein